MTFRQHLRYQLDGKTGIAVVTLNTPKQLNALKLLQIWEMFFVLEHAANDDQVPYPPGACHVESTTLAAVSTRVHFYMGAVLVRDF